MQFTDQELECYSTLKKNSTLEIVNATRELSKVMDKPTPAANKEMKRVLKYVIDIKDYGLKINPTPLSSNGMFEVILLSDSDWAGDTGTRKSVTGYCIFLSRMSYKLEI
jgi:hypothetical protein